MERAVLIGVDSRDGELRAWAFDADGTVISDATAPFAPAPDSDSATALVTTFLRNNLPGADRIPVVACGNLDTGPGQGTGHFVQVPMLLNDLCEYLDLRDGIHVVPGLKRLSPPDILNGEETQLFGLGDLSGDVCIPGMHTRHISLEQGRVLDFSSEMTGEIHKLLLGTGALALRPGIEQKFDMAIFRDWVERSLDTDDAASPFAVRAARLIGTLRPEHQSAALSGLLIGACVAAHYDPGDDVLLVADGHRFETYGMALDTLGASVEEYSAIETLQDGLFEIADESGLLDT